MEYLTIKVDILESLESSTIKNPFFDKRKWCKNDIARLEKVAAFIKREIEREV